MDRTLLLRPDRAGDALKTLPALRALKLEFPEREIHLLASEHNASLFEHEPGIKLHHLPRNWKRMKKERWLSVLGFSSIFPHFDRVINLLCDPSEEADLLLTSVPARAKYTARLADEYGSLAREITRLDLPATTPAGRKETENIAHLLGQVFNVHLEARLAEVATGPVLSPDDLTESAEKMGPKFGQWLGFCPFAGNSHRTPPLARWQRFVQKATEDETFNRFFLFGTPSDYARLQELRQVSPRKDSIELCFPSSFRTLGAYLQRLDGVVAVDSGPLHLALSLGVRSLGILSGGDVKRWFDPINQGDMLVRRGLFQRYPSVFEMMRAFAKWVPSAAAV